MIGRPVGYSVEMETTDEEEMGKQYLCEVLEVLNNVVRASAGNQDT